jgi:hypothetical protein
VELKIDAVLEEEISYPAVLAAEEAMVPRCTRKTILQLKAEKAKSHVAKSAANNLKYSTPGS